MVVLEIVEFGVVPIVLVWAFVVVALTPGRLPYVQARRSARAGVWAGPALVVVLALRFPPNVEQYTAITGIHPWGALLGLASGLAAPVVIRRAQLRELERARRAHRTNGDTPPRGPDVPAGAEPDGAADAPTPTFRRRLRAMAMEKTIAGHWEARTERRKRAGRAAGRSWMAALTLVLSTSSAGAGYLYAVLPSSRGFTASVVLCGVLGVLMAIVLKPSVSTEFRRPAIHQL